MFVWIITNEYTGVHGNDCTIYGYAKVKNEVVLHRFSNIVAGVPFLRGCTDDTIVEICMFFRGQTASPDDVIVDMGDDRKDLVVMGRGSATGTSDDTGTSKVITTYVKGSFFGELQVGPTLANAYRACRRWSAFR